MISQSDVVGIVKQCVKYGQFELHSGKRSNWICDLLEAKEFFKHFVYLLVPRHTLVGIEFGGALLVASTKTNYGIVRKDSNFYAPGLIKDGRIITLVDDVVTTEDSFRHAEMILNHYSISVGERLVVLDRRKEITLPIRSLVTAQMLGFD